jgi:hypothetical protein
VPMRLATPRWHGHQPPPHMTLSPSKPPFHVHLGLILPPFEREKHSTALLPCHVHCHSPSPSSCPPPPPCPHLELPPHCSSVANVATDWSRSAAPQATGIVPRAPRSHPRAAIPMTSHQREVGVIHLVREGTTPSTPHLRPPPTTDDVSSSFVVAPCCSTDLEPAAPTTVQCHRH